MKILGEYGLFSGVGASIGFSVESESANGTISLPAMGCRWWRWVWWFGGAGVDGKLEEEEGFWDGF
jgi:hypothetical protein